MLVGSLPGVFVGGRISLAVPDRALRLTLASVLGLSGLKLSSPTLPQLALLLSLLALAVAGVVALDRRGTLRLRRLAQTSPVPTD